MSRNRVLEVKCAITNDLMHVLDSISKSEHSIKEITLPEERYHINKDISTV